MDNSLGRKLSLRIVGILGVAIFTTFFALTYSVPGWVEGYGSDYIEGQVEKRIDTTIELVRPPESDNALARMAQSIYEKNKVQIEQLKSDLRGKVHEQWASALALIRDLDCECRDKIAKFIEEGFTTNIAILEATNDKIIDFIHFKYAEVTVELKRDIRIFSASNAAVFLLLLLISFLKPRAVAHLFLPGALLAASTAICSYFYVFEQNWLLTMIHNNYLGFAYLGWLGFVFLILCDIVFNKGRITTEIVNAILNAIGSAASLLPC